MTTCDQLCFYILLTIINALKLHIRWHQPDVFLLLYIHITFMIIYDPLQHVCVGVAHCCVCAFRAAVGRSASDGEVHSVDGSLHCKERRCSAAQQHRHHAHPALHQLHRPHQQPCCWSVHILKALFDQNVKYRGLKY